MPGEQTENLEISTPIGGLKAATKDLNTMATVLTLCMVLLSLYIGFIHQQDTKEASQAFVGVLREQTTAVKAQTSALREQNCLVTYQGPAPDKQTFCKHISQ